MGFNWCELFFRYVNKFVLEKGLVFLVFDIFIVEDGKVIWGNGLMYYKGR